ncbi:type VI secretion system Vgr family protein [Paraburkholderia acidipaludis]|uniref:type VI secretion system Vgr family protein n=1 Tax=Paraburkholderia acidipaludis TaxID=660537 RepID=UPI001FE03198|nr:type VI secretion system Vgr family protein [Paraburkholderia acidipaludis]
MTRSSTSSPRATRNVGFHFGLEPKTVAGVAFLWSNPDRPFISHVLHTAKHTDPVLMGYPWAQRNTIHTRSNNTIQLDDRQGEEHIKVATEHGKSQLNLGHRVDRSNGQRSSGAELRTDGAAAVRGGAGVMVSAYARNGASGKPLDMQETVAQLEGALALAKALASSAQASKAEAADTGSQQAVNKSLQPVPAGASTSQAPSAKQIRKASHLLEKQVRRALVRVKGLDSTNVVVVARGGVVTLGGSVPAASQIPPAVSGSQHVSGATEAHDSLQVRMPVP